MKTKKRAVIAAAVIILISAVLLTVFSPRINNGINNLRASEFTAQDLKNVDNIVLMTHCAEVDGQTNSVAGVKEAVRLGADAVVVDLCFREDGTPVMSDNYDNVGSAPALENLFKALNDGKYADIKIFLNIVQLSDMSKLNKLAVDYGFVPRLAITGIDDAHYGLITGEDTIIPFYLNRRFTSDEIDSMKDGTFSVPEELEQYGAIGFAVKVSDADPAVIEALGDYGIPSVITDIKNNRQLSEVLLANASAVWVSDIEGSHEFLDGWIKEMQQRFESSVEASLKALSTTTAADK